MALDAPMLVGLGFLAGLLLALAVLRRGRRTARELRAEMLDLTTQARNARDTRDAVGEVIGSMTQRVLGPLQNISAYARALEQGGNLTPAQRDLAHATAESGRQVEQVLGDALQVSLSTTGSLAVEEAEVEVHDLLASVARSVRGRCIKKGLQFSLLLGPDLPARIVTDGMKMRYVLQNMVNDVISTTHTGAVTFWAATYLTPTPGNTEVQLAFEACAGDSRAVMEPGARLVGLRAGAGSAGTAEDDTSLTLAEQFVRVLGGELVAVEGADGSLSMHCEITVHATEPQPAPVIELGRAMDAPWDGMPVAAASVVDAGFFGVAATEQERLIEAALEQPQAN